MVCVLKTTPHRGPLSVSHFYKFEDANLIMETLFFITYDTVSCPPYFHK